MNNNQTLPDLFHHLPSHTRYQELVDRWSSGQDDQVVDYQSTKYMGEETKYMGEEVNGEDVNVHGFTNQYESFSNQSTNVKLFF